MSVFTIYCHGTGGHRDKSDDEIVAFMGRRATGVEYSNFLILDGVGREIGAAVGARPMFIESLATLGVDVQGTVVKLPAPGSAFDSVRCTTCRREVT